ncbi:MAG: transcriptional regulator [Xanthobacteraceae bacterium]
MRYVFDACVLDTDRRELRRDDAMVAVEPQVFDLIAYLIRNRDRVVDRDDLRAAIWSGRIVSESTLNTRINAARSAVGDSGDEQRLIRTLPRKGFRFVGDVREDDAALPQPDTAADRAPASGADRQVAVWQADGDVTPAPQPVPAELLVPSGAVRQASRARRIALAGAAVTAAVVLALVLINARPRIDAMLHPPQRFDADAMPLIAVEGRRDLAGYPAEPDEKAIALSAQGSAKAVGAPDRDSAKQEALERCRMRPKAVCRLYAVGMDVVWNSGLVPMPVATDVRLDPLPDPPDQADWQLLAPNPTGSIIEEYKAGAPHKALAISGRGVWYVSGRGNRDEVVRLALERCGYAYQSPCLVALVDTAATVEIPKSGRITGVFLPGTDPSLGEDRSRVAQVYAGRAWRAVARGRGGSWHPVAGAPSEAAAIEASLQDCAKADAGCRVFAVGNLLVDANK